MTLVVLTLVYLAMAYCAAVLIAPQLFRNTVDFFSLGSRLYVIGLISIVAGILSLVLSAQTRLWGYVVTVGIMLTAFGASLFFIALRRTKKLLTRLKHQSNLALRLYALAALFIWCLLVYSLLPAVPD